MSASFSLMAHYSDKEKEEIIKHYFGPSEEGENPRCPHCGELLHFKSIYDSPDPHLKIAVSCPDCQAHFTWNQPGSGEPWKPLHLDYFLERYRIGQSIRCPFDDCYVTYTEFSDAVVEFRCPYCNHRARVALKKDG